MHQRKTYLLIAITALLIAILHGCSSKPQPEPVVKKEPNTFTVNGSMREMSIAQETPAFPEYEGRAEFQSYCAMCHSLKYISMQPDFPRKTWEAEVTKMVAKYKAPIDSVTSKKIVDYLVQVKTKQ